MSDSSDEGEVFRLRDYDEDESEDERPNKRRKMVKEPVLRARGLGFVSATAQDEDDDQNEDDIEDERPTMGLGMGGFRSGFDIGEYDDQSYEEPPSTEVPADSQMPQTSGRGPSAFGVGGRIQKNSFAARMMAKQGYVEGQGLGKSGQGITAPIQSQILQTRAGLGHGTPEPKREKKPKIKAGDGSRASTPGGATPRIKALPKAKYNVTAIESRGLHIPEAMKSIIVDATGAETKVVSGLSGFSTPTNERVPTETEKASGRIKMQLQAYADAWDTTMEQEARFIQEESQLAGEINVHLAEMQRFEDIITEFGRVSMDDSGQSRAWEQIIQRLQDVQEKFADSIEELDLPEITVSFLEAPFRRELADWDPLSDDGQLITTLQSIGSLLEIEKSVNPNRLSRPRKRTTPFETLLLQHWFPRLRTCLKDWTVYNPEPATAVFESWSSLLPAWLQYKILDEIILPKLIEAVRRFPKSVADSGNSVATTTNGTTSSSKKRKAPELFSWLFDWWPHMSSPQFDLERFPELRSLIKSKVDSTSWPVWKSILGKSKPATTTTTKSTSTPSTPLPPTASAVSAEEEEISLKDIVEEWCAENDLVLRSSGQSDPLGRLLYRLQDAERRSRGVLIYFQGNVVFDVDGEVYDLGEKLIEKARAGKR